jgi:hypothetical protein
VNGKPLHRVLDEQVHIAFVGDGPLSSRAFVAQTSAAEQLLSGPEGVSFERVVRGVLSRLDGQEATAPVDGISLSSDAAGYAVNWTMVELEWEGRDVGPRPIEVAATTPAADRVAIIDALRSNVRDNAMLDDMPAGMVDIAVGHRWLTFGPGATRELLSVANGTSDARRASQLLGLVRHEIEHRRTSLNLRDQWKPEAHAMSFTERKQLDLLGLLALVDDVNWIEETTANVLSRWPGEMEATMRAAGITEPLQPLPPVAYVAATRALERLLELAGADPSADATGTTADDLLQQRPIGDVPSALASRIAGRLGLDQETTRELRDRIHHLTNKVEIAQAGGDAKVEERLAQIEALIAAGSAATSD